MKNLIGKRLDARYEFLELIGVGGMANVYKAYDELRNCNVAIKVLKDKYLDNKEFVYRFRNESKANASLSHPNIVRIFDVGFGDKIQYIVMEYIEGVTLKEFMDKAKILNWKDVVHFVFQILRGLQHAHDKGIVHRDMKPENVMLLEDGTVKIMDFGIARFPRDERVNFKKTVGSVHYISPEQAVGGVTDFKSDIYSVGIMMYEMLTGQLPFQGKIPEVVVSKQINESVKSPLEINPNLPQGLVDIILRAIKKNPEDRYQTAEEMLRDIDEFKQNPNISFGYRYLDDIENTKYFGIPSNRPSDSGVLNYQNRGVKKKKSKLVPILCGVAGAFFIVSIIMVVIFMLGRNKNSVQDIEIPNFVGMRVEEIKTIDNGKYKDLGITVKYEPSSKFPAGVVLEQTVRPGTIVKSNYDNLTLITSSGTEVKTVPRVIGMPVSKAESILKKSGFINVKKVEKEDENAAANAVVAIDPKEKIQVAYDTPITIYYNPAVTEPNSTEVEEKEEMLVDVPKVVGMSVFQAAKTLKDAGFEISVKRVNEAGRPKGVIIWQNKTKAAIGSKIEVVENVRNENLIDEKKYEKKGDDSFDKKTLEDFKKSLENEKRNLEDEKNKGINKSHSNSNVMKSRVKIPLHSYVKLKDFVNVIVVDGEGNTIKEFDYDTGTKKNIILNIKDVKGGSCKVIVKNKETNKEAVYARLKILSDEIELNKDPGVFSSIASKNDALKNADELSLF